MAWGRKEPELPKEFGDRTPEQVAQELAALRAENERLRGFETELTTVKSANETVQSELQTVKASLDALRANQPKPAASTTTSPSKTDFLDNGDQAFAERFVEGVRPLADATMQNSARLAQMVAEQSMTAEPRKRYLMNKYRSEYDSLVGQLSPVQRTIEDAYKNCLDVIIGRHISDIADKGTAFFSENAGGPPPTPAPKTEEATSEEHAMAKRFGISDQDYLKSKKQIQFVGAA